MDDFRSYNTEEPSPQRGRFFCFLASANKGAERDDVRPAERGNALLYVFLAIGLLAALSYAYVRDSRENYASQSAVQIAETLFSQVNMIKGAIVQCALEYPAGGGDMNGDNVINSSDNPNTPYPLNPTSSLNATRQLGVPPVTDAIAAAVNDNVRNLTCVGAPSSVAYMFQGASNQGRFLPPPPGGFSEWVYKNDTTGVYIQITAPSDSASISALSRLVGQFCTAPATSCASATLSGLVFTAWIQQN